MADKRSVKKSIKQLQRVKTWQLVLLLVLALLIAMTFLRLNNVGMVERRNAVLAADEAGDDIAIQERLYDLQRYSNKHMNASTGQIYLVEKYNRDVAAIREAAASTDNPNGNIYKLAAEHCDQLYASYSPAYQQCFMSELERYPSDDGVAVTIDLPNQNIYRYEYISPLISYDFAGLSIIVCLVLILMIVIRAISMMILRIILRWRYRSI